MRRLRLRCPAKVNLHLEVLGKRPDGYHEVRTLLTAIGLFDELELAPAPEGSIKLTVESGNAVPVEGNIVLEAARRLAEATGTKAGAHIRLSKSIPVAAGLGGGSSNAAAALVGLSQLWEIPGRWEGLFPLAAEIGADVPFFLLGGLCWGVGRGDEVYPLPDLPESWVVLLPGREPVPTAAVYAALSIGPERRFPQPTVYKWLLQGGPLPVTALVNDLQKAAVRLFPWVGEALERMKRCRPELALVSGSGGTVFGLFTSAQRARQAAGMLQDLGALAVPILSRYQSRLGDFEIGGAYGNNRGARQPDPAR